MNNTLKWKRHDVCTEIFNDTTACRQMIDEVKARLVENWEVRQANSMTVLRHTTMSK